MERRVKILFRKKEFGMSQLVALARHDAYLSTFTECYPVMLFMLCVLVTAVF
jgi:hypothetical protein